MVGATIAIGEVVVVGAKVVTVEVVVVGAGAQRTDIEIEWGSPAESVKEAVTPSVPGPPVSEYDHVAVPAESVVSVAPCPMLGPLATENVTGIPTSATFPDAALGK